MISIFRDKSIVAILGLVIVCVLVHFHIFMEPVHINSNANSGVLSWVFQVFFSKLHPVFITIIYILILFVQAIRLNLILNNSKMFSKNGFTTALAFIILSGLFTNAFTLSPALIANSLAIWLFNNAIKLYNNPSAKSLIFNIAFLASTSVILYQPTVFIVVSLLFALAILRPFKITEWIIFIVGLVAPVYLLISGMYLFNTLPLLNKFIPQIHFKFLIIKDTWYWINFSTISLLVIAGLFTWYPNSNRMVIQTRKSWVVMLILFTLSLMGILFFNSTKYLPEILSIIPMAAFVSNFFLYSRRAILVSLFFISAIVIIVCNNLQLLKMM